MLQLNKYEAVQFFLQFGIIWSIKLWFFISILMTMLCGQWSSWIFILIIQNWQFSLSFFIFPRIGIFRLLILLNVYIHWSWFFSSLQDCDCFRHISLSRQTILARPQFWKEKQQVQSYSSLHSVKNGEYYARSRVGQSTWRLRNQSCLLASR